MLKQSIPVADLKQFLSCSDTAEQHFVDLVGNALRDHGFFSLVNHGVDEELVKRAYAKAKDFFHLPSEIKEQYEDPDLNGQRGFVSFAKESAKAADAPDLKEFWHIGRELTSTHRRYKELPKNIWPKEVQDFQAIMLAVYQQIERCALHLLDAISLYIGEHKQFLRMMTVEGNSILRLIHYPPIPDNAHPQSIRAAAHEDINLITLLCESTAEGLEIQNKDDSWTAILALDGQIIVDSGDMLQNLTNGYLRSTTHRVVKPAQSFDERFSMPFFTHPLAKADLSPRAKCIEKTGGIKEFPDITQEEYLNQRLTELGLKR